MNLIAHNSSIDYDVLGWNLPDLAPAQRIFADFDLDGEIADALGDRGPDHRGDSRNAVAAKRRAFLAEHNLRWAPTNNCLHALPHAGGLPTGARVCTGKCSMMSEFSLDHSENLQFVGAGRREVDLYTMQPYPIASLPDRVRGLVLRAEAVGLETWLAARQSWHLPGKTVLIVVQRPGTVDLTRNDGCPSHLS